MGKTQKLLILLVVFGMAMLVLFSRFQNASPTITTIEKQERIVVLPGSAVAASKPQAAQLPDAEFLLDRSLMGQSIDLELRPYIPIKRIEDVNILELFKPHITTIEETPFTAEMEEDLALSAQRYLEWLWTNDHEILNELTEKENPSRLERNGRYTSETAAEQRGKRLLTDGPIKGIGFPITPVRIERGNLGKLLEPSLIENNPANSQFRDSIADSVNRRFDVESTLFAEMYFMVNMGNNEYKTGFVLWAYDEDRSTFSRATSGFFNATNPASDIPIYALR